jgi:outer membrane protein
VATDQYNLINADNNFKLNTVIVKEFLLLPTSFDFRVSAPDSIIVQQNSVSLYEAQNEAQRTRPEVKNKEVQIQISQAELEKTKAAVQPTISLDAGLATGYSDNQRIEYLPQLNDNFYQSLGVSMGIPIYSRRVNKTSINKSRILLKQSQLALYDTQTTLNQLVEQTYINLQNARAQYTAAEIQLKTSEEVYHITNEQMKLGAVSTLELLQEKNAYVQALQAFTQAKYTVVLYNKIYEFYMGIPVTF